METIIKQGQLIDNIYYLPNIELDRKEYLKLADHLKFLGGKWNRAKKGFIFDRDIETIDELLGDNSKKKKELQFFETPEKLANELVALADIDNYTSVLEPSAGRGRIIEAIHRKYPSLMVNYCEINETNRGYLKILSGAYKLDNDFLKLKGGLHNRIIANPPFSKNQDIEHIMKMYDHLDNGGIMVSIASTHWQFSNNKKETEFRAFLKYTKAEIIKLEENTFQESGTKVKAVIIRILK